MASKSNPHELKLIVQNSLKTRVTKLLVDTRTHSVKSEFLILDNMSQQDSIVYSWYFKTLEALEAKRVDVAQRLTNEYITDYLMVVT
jgi:hypothetical protein